MENVPAAPASSGNQNQGNAPATTDNPNAEATANAGSSNEQGGFDTRSKPLHPLVRGFQKLSMMRQVWLMLALAASIALGFAIVLWSQGATYRPLMSGDTSYEVQDIVSVLNQAGIDFNMDPTNGVVLVRDSQLNQARMAVAQAGLSNDETVGMELLEESGGLGTSQFLETARYRRALEGELSRTIASLNAVRSSRVHLAIPERSVFVRDDRTASASVFVDLHSGGQLSEENVRGIINLVANSVPQMNAEQVSVVDQRGNLLSDLADENSAEAETERQLEFTRQVEENIQRRVNNILQPIIGSDRFRAQVNADLDFTRVEQAEELYNPDLIALRSEQILEETTTGPDEGGVPGALTNQPPGDAEAPEEAQGDGEGQTPPPQTQRSEATRNYEVDRTMSYTQNQVGRLRRLTVAVAVDDMRQATGDGQMETVPWNQQDLERLRILVQDAVGYDASRGDSVNVINTPFMAEQEAIEDIPFWEEAWFWELMRPVLGGLFILILIFFVVRPALGTLMRQGEEDEEDDSGLDALDIDESAISDDKVTLSMSDDYLLPGPSESFDKQLEALRGLIAEDPGRVSVVLKKWIMSDD